MVFWIGNISYEIIDEIISPMCGISGVFADLYLADIVTYADTKELQEKILRKIYRKYNIKKNDVFLNANMPIALLALAVIENGKYKKR